MPRKLKPCHYFQIGICNKGTQCTYAHVMDPNFKRKGCIHHAQGKCKRGDKCTYSHLKEDMDQLSPTSPSEVDHYSGAVSGAATTEADFRQWRYQVPGADRIATARALGTATPKFWQDALRLVSGDAGIRQETITYLASNGGCLRILELAGQHVQLRNNAQFSRTFIMQILPFFKTITHTDVTTSIILAPRLTTIYNVLYGPDGERAVSLFAAVVQYLQTLTFNEEDRSNPISPSSLEALETSLAAFEKLVEINTAAQVHDGLKLSVETLALIFEDNAEAMASFASRPTQRHLRRLQQRFGLGHALPQVCSGSALAGEPAVFELAGERPGELSEDGPRHDNDHVDIREISILPTMQEVQSSRTEYLPSADPREWHLGGLEGLFDRHFRLLREDTVGQLRDAAKVELERLQDDSANGNDRHKRQTARTFVYHNIEIADVAFDASSGINFVIAFDQPEALQRLTCLLSVEGDVTFFVASPPPFNASKEGAGAPLHQQYKLWSDAQRAYTVVKPVMHDDTSTLLERLLGDSDEDLSLVEFPGVLLPAFKPTLQALQSMSETLDVPFGDILAPTSTLNNPGRHINVVPPAYAARPGFSFDLSSFTDAEPALHLTPGTNTEHTINQLARRSTLDQGQAEAVVRSLSRSLALIQGPPGTGKSYTGVQLIKILLANKLAGGLGPIVCVCFTNHAIDQGLERLLDEGVQHVIRIGGSSKSERLADVDLREVSQRLELTKTEKNDRWRLKGQAHREVEEINHLLGLTGQTHTDVQMGTYLAAHYPRFHDQLFVGIDDDGFTKVQRQYGKVVDGWLKGAPWGFGLPRTIDELLNVHVNHMTGQERRKLYSLWLTDIRTELFGKLRTATDSYNQAKTQLDAVRTEQNLRVLKQANIIGLTTSGLARNLDLIRRIGAKVLLCEEAGEVLEAHLLTALLPSIEHAILIGDHQQLRPHIQNNDLSTESRSGAQYSLDVSLFERLVQPQDVLTQVIPFSILSVQRRMHPSISQLLRKIQYPHLQDAPTVDHPEVMGMRHRLFWLHHEHKENGDVDTAVSLSHTNEYEMDMVAALVRHLVSQGIYSSEDVAVITPYLGQLRKIRKRLGATFNIILNDRDIEELHKGADVNTDTEQTLTEKTSHKGSSARGTLLQALRPATVDNFQGEEAKVVIVSLVRSNANNKPGFLRTSNRINVLLSRAQHGMYVIGDANTMSHVPMWADVISTFRQEGLFGMTLELCCPRHKDTPLQITVPDDFVRIAPEAGCDLPCDKQLACGHACKPIAQRGSLRPHRERSLLDESTKKLIAWSNRTHSELSDRLASNQEESLTNTGADFTQIKDLTLRGSLTKQVATVKKLKISKRYRKVFNSRNTIQSFADKLRKDEQPYQRVRDMVETLRRSKDGADQLVEFQFASSELQLREHLQAISLLIRCDLIIYSDVVAVHKGQGAGRAGGAVSVETSAQRTRCDQLITDAQSSLNVRQEVEGQLFWAKFAAMDCDSFDVTLEAVSPVDSLRNQTINAEALQRLRDAETVCKRFVDRDTDPTKGLMEEIQDARRTLNEGLSTSEMRMVVTAMTKEFSGTGHWYRCANGHPFTVGECGMPMQLARCPACGAGIGGQHHQPTEGVQAAHDIERQLVDLRSETRVQQSLIVNDIEASTGIANSLASSSLSFGRWRFFSNILKMPGMLSMGLAVLDYAYNNSPPWRSEWSPNGSTIS
ncbi:hypothetical protein LTR82_015801 [Friedmanniomyces endolithicus]|uniref:NFX1-type zinc finger-containing protein 1 n=1 Tax=Friedmanniomyces endolithicus TaxID=329885 RepID=A0AAN6F8Z5_9PEZI|nr:hypothetical protein LTR82_015801 [Friedmanniomyces endolithicus]